MNNSAARTSWRNSGPGAILLVLVGLIGGASLTAWVVAAGQRTPIMALSTATATPLADSGCWTSVALPVTAPNAELQTILTEGAGAWAFGTTGDGGATAPLLLHDTGSGWASVQAPPISPTLGTAAWGIVGPTRIWPVGSTERPPGPAIPLHGDGTRWAEIPPFTTGATNNTWRAYAVAGPDDFWAAGNYGGPDGAGVLLWHWTGAAWQPTTPPALPTEVDLLGLGAISPREVWAVGTRGPDSGVALHWDGTRWQTVPLPTGVGALTSVAGTDPAHVWAAGRTPDHQPLLLRWDGQAWQSLPRPLGGTSVLYSPVAGIGGDVWVLGSTEGRDVPAQVLHWTPAGWSHVPQPLVPPAAHLVALARQPDGTLLLAGSYRDSLSGLTHALIVRYRPGACPGPPPIPTGQAGTALPALPPPVVSAPGGQEPTESGCWTQAALPAGASEDIQSIGAEGATAWAFGTVDTGRGGEPLIVRENGQGWQSAPTPPLRPTLGATAWGIVTRDGIWPVGGTERPPGPAIPLHGDGTRWAEIPQPTTGTYRNEWRAFAAMGAEAWAAGVYSNMDGTGGLLLWHWTGAAWQPTTPPVSSADVDLGGLAVLAPNDVWTVGTRGPDSGVVLRWDGTRWQTVPLPAGVGALTGVAGTGPAHVWVAGRTPDHQPLLLRWDGQAWQAVPRPLGGTSVLYSPVAGATDDVWVLGSTEGQDVPAQVLHWTPAGWSHVPQPVLPPSAHTVGLVRQVGGPIWLAATYVDGVSSLIRSTLIGYRPGPCAASPPAASPVPEVSPQQITLPAPVPTGISAGVGPYLFLFRGSATGYQVVAYEPLGGQERVLEDLPGLGYEVSGFASDGQTVVWIERHPPNPVVTVRGYDLRAGRLFTVLETSGATASLGPMAVAGGVLYYTRFPLNGVAPTQAGLLARSLATGQETQISPVGSNPVAADGVLLWQERAPFPTPTAPAGTPPATPDPALTAPMSLPQPEECTLHLRKLDGSIVDRVISRFDCFGGERGYSGYSIAGDYVVWAGGPRGPDGLPVTLYTISSKTPRLIAANASIQAVPLLHGNVVVWTAQPAGAPGDPYGSALLAYHLDTGTLAWVIRQGGATILPQVFFDPQTLVYTLDRHKSFDQPTLYRVTVP